MTITTRFVLLYTDKSLLLDWSIICWTILTWSLAFTDSKEILINDIIIIFICRMCHRLEILVVHLVVVDFERPLVAGEHSILILIETRVHQTVFASIIIHHTWADLVIGFLRFNFLDKSTHIEIVQVFIWNNRRSLLLRNLDLVVFGGGSVNLGQLQ